MSHLLAWQPFCFIYIYIYPPSLLVFVCWAIAPLLTFGLVFWVPPGSHEVSKVVGSEITWHGEQGVIERSVYSWGQYLILTQRNIETFTAVSSSGNFFFFSWRALVICPGCMSQLDSKTAASKGIHNEPGSSAYITACHQRAIWDFGSDGEILMFKFLMTPPCC